MRFLHRRRALEFPRTPYYDYHGLKWCCRPGEEAIIHSAVQQFDQYNGKPSVVLDVGAHVGSVALAAAQRGVASVLAFEPASENFRFLMANIDVNGFLGRITPFKLAVTSHDWGTCLLRSAPGLNSGQRSTMFKDDFHESSDLALTISLSTVLKMRALYGGECYLKIDVEGAEFPMLLETPRECFKAVQFLDLEVHDPTNATYFPHSTYTVPLLLDWLRRCGFGNGNLRVRIV